MKSLLFFIIQIFFIHQVLCESQTLREDNLGNYTVTIYLEVETGNMFLEAMSTLTGDIYGPTQIYIGLAIDVVELHLSTDFVIEGEDQEAVSVLPPIYDTAVILPLSDQTSGQKRDNLMQLQIQDLKNKNEVLTQQNDDLKNQTDTLNATLISVINQLNALVNDSNTQKEALSYMIDSRSCEIKNCTGSDWISCSCDNGKLAINCGCDAYDGSHMMRAVGIMSKNSCYCGGFGGPKSVTVMCC